ncbi:hypothetical protein NE865_07203 [Phthorimaea operculella]|nr:hypothetical protein NE865_07203 [Phthorimaea operculella]
MINASVDMLEHLGHHFHADLIRRAVHKTINQDSRHAGAPRTPLPRRPHQAGRAQDHQPRQNVANPVAMINASVDMLEHLGHHFHADLIRRAVHKTINQDRWVWGITQHRPKRDDIMTLYYTT